MSAKESTKLKKLKAKWEEKLKKSGFRDIEDEQGRLIDHRSTEDLWKRIGGSMEVFRATQDYFRWAEDMANHGLFRSRSDKRIWALHAQGKTCRDIGKKMKFHHTHIMRKIHLIRAYLGLQPTKEALDLVEDMPLRKRRAA